MDWMPIPDGDGNLAALLVSAKDITYVRELEISRERSLEEVHNLMNIIKHGPAKMDNYIRSERGLIQKTLTALTAVLGNQDSKESLGLIMRNIHTIKGNSRSGVALDSFMNGADLKLLVYGYVQAKKKIPMYILARDEDIESVVEFLRQHEHLPIYAKRPQEVMALA